MKTMGSAWKTVRLFAMIAAGLALAVSAASAQAMPDNNIARCDCNKDQGIAQYVNNVVSDAQQRGLSREQAKMHATACFAVWCSLCSGLPGAVDHCISTANAYFDAAPGFDRQQRPAVANMPIR